jgi:hypothetical protein
MLVTESPKRLSASDVERIMDHARQVRALDRREAVVGHSPQDVGREAACRAAVSVDETNLLHPIPELEDARQQAHVLAAQSRP